MPSDRRRAGNPGREGYVTGPTPVGRTVSDSDMGRPDYTRAPGATVNAMGGPRRAGSRAAIMSGDDEVNMPNMYRSESFPEMPTGRTVRRLKKGGPVKKPPTKKSKSGQKRR